MSLLLKYGKEEAIATKTRNKLTAHQVAALHLHESLFSYHIAIPTNKFLPIWRKKIFS